MCDVCTCTGEMTMEQVAIFDYTYKQIEEQFNLKFLINIKF